MYSMYCRTHQVIGNETLLNLSVWKVATSANFIRSFLCLLPLPVFFRVLTGEESIPDEMFVRLPLN